MIDAIVYLYFSNEVKSAEMKFLNKIANHRPIVFVNMKLQELCLDGEIHPVSNCIFEFGGYQIAFDKLINNDMKKILIINSTIFENPFFYYHKYMVKKLLSIKSTNNDEIYGDLRVVPYGSKNNFIVSNVFLLNNITQSINFVDSQSIEIMCDDSPNTLKLKKIEAAYPTDFLAHVNSWLSPKRVWKGWYKASIRSPISVDVRLRKTFAINCEHTLLLHNPHLVPVNIVDGRLSRFLRSIYVFRLNVRKIWYRVQEIIK